MNKRQLRVFARWYVGITICKTFGHTRPQLAEFIKFALLDLTPRCRRCHKRVVTDGRVRIHRLDSPFMMVADAYQPDQIH